MKYFIFLFCSILFFACHKEPLKLESESEVQLSESATVELRKSKRGKENLCEYKMFGFADFPFQQTLFPDGSSYPIDFYDQLRIRIEDYETNPYFHFTTTSLKFCSTDYASMWNENECVQFEVIQTLFVQSQGQNEILFFFDDPFWDCFNHPNVYPGMEFRFEHSKKFIS